MINEILALFLGFIFVTIIDRLWFSINYKKAEKGLEVLEHYHFGIGLLILFPWILFATPWAFIVFAAGAAFIYHESKQKNYFAHKSTHAKGSTIIGIVLCTIALASYSYMWFI